MTLRYQICTECIMDTTDPDIEFDEHGVCSHCLDYRNRGKPIVDNSRSASGAAQLTRLVERMKRRGKGKEYDCVIGISGGVDSSYVAYQVKKLELRPLAVHVDSGWNSELAVNNIENIVKTLGFDLYTHVVDWEENRDLQLAFFKASLANCDVPQDHAFLAVLYHLAAKHGIHYIISGGNAATEFVLPKSWGYNAGDLRHLKAVHAIFGQVRLRQFPTLNFLARYFYYPYVRNIRAIRLLNYLPYNKDDAKRVIQDALGWRDYGGKHYESVFTRFFQAYYLPVKFGFDKRRAHYSSLIVTDQMTRDEALRYIQQPTYDEAKLAEEKEYVAKKLGISLVEFDAIMQQPPKSYRDYPSNERLFQLKDWAVAKLGIRA